MTYIINLNISINITRIIKNIYNMDVQSKISILILILCTNQSVSTELILQSKSIIIVIFFLI